MRHPRIPLNDIVCLLRSSIRIHFGSVGRSRNRRHRRRLAGGGVGVLSLDVGADSYGNATDTKLITEDEDLRRQKMR